MGKLVLEIPDEVRAALRLPPELDRLRRDAGFWITDDLQRKDRDPECEHGETAAAPVRSDLRVIRQT